MTKVVIFDDQQITLTTPSPLACVTTPSKLSVTFQSTLIPHSTAAKLRFSSVSFYIAKGVKHEVHELIHGKRKTVTVYVANATRRKAPASIGLSSAGLKAGIHPLKVVISYRTTVTKHGHKTTTTVTKTLLDKFTIC